VTEASRYLREHEASEVIATAEDAARRQPALVIAGGFALGLVTARLLRSATPSYGRSSYRPTWHSGSDWYSSGGSSGYGRGSGRRMGDTSSQLASGADYSAGGDYATGSTGYSSAPYAAGTSSTSDTSLGTRGQRGTSAGGTTATTTDAAGATRGSTTPTGSTGTSQRRSISESTQGEGS
jgi:hypothetical protein